MELFRVGEVVAQSTRASLLPSLNPSLACQCTTRRLVATPLRHLTRTQQSAKRSFSTTLPKKQTSEEVQGGPKTSAADGVASDSQKKPVSKEILSILENTAAFSKPQPARSTGGGQGTSRPPSLSAFAMNKNVNSAGRVANAFASANSSLSSILDQRSTQIKPLGMSMPPALPDEAPLPRLGPTTGRTVQVRESSGLVRSFRTLEILCRNNRVRSDFMRQRFHERPGMKRKRLKCERWRRQFKSQFVQTIALARRMKSQGW